MRRATVTKLDITNKRRREDQSSAPSEAELFRTRIVEPGETLMVLELYTNDIIVEPGGKLVIRGVVAADVHVHGGDAEVYGTVCNLVMDGGKAMVVGEVGAIRGTGEVRYEAGAVIGGRTV